MKRRNKYLKYMKSFKDFPKRGIVFWDFTNLLKNPKILKQAISDIKNHFKNKKITKIAAIESKGFIIGTALAYEIKKQLFLIRKPNLIPSKTISEKFEKEYGFGEYQIKKDAFKKNDKVLIVYDILAGSGATQAAINLIEKTGAEVVGCAYIIELSYLKGRESLNNYDLFSLIEIKEKNMK